MSFHGLSICTEVSSGVSIHGIVIDHNLKDQLEHAIGPGVKKLLLQRSLTAEETLNLINAVAMPAKDRATQSIWARRRLFVSDVIALENAQHNSPHTTLEFKPSQPTRIKLENEFIQRLKLVLDARAFYEQSKAVVCSRSVNVYLLEPIIHYLSSTGRWEYYDFWIYLSLAITLENYMLRTPKIYQIGAISPDVTEQYFVTRYFLTRFQKTECICIQGGDLIITFIMWDESTQMEIELAVERKDLVGTRVLELLNS
ncbi:hypothetical protein LTR64_008751 [Lithohypha guttulata]|uniref:uncharacterized protein n=1 Tax=Lithohypha guttulata TaxID=1690604 RepID=UPI00315D9F03